MKLSQTIFYLLVIAHLLLSNDAFSKTNCPSDRTVLVQDVAATIEDELSRLVPQERTTDRLFQGCGQGLTPEERFSVLKRSYLENLSVGRVPTTGTGRDLARFLRETGTEGEKFLTTVKTLFGPALTHEQLESSLDQLSSAEAELVALRLIESNTNPMNTEGYRQNSIKTGALLNYIRDPAAALWLLVVLDGYAFSEVDTDLILEKVYELRYSDSSYPRLCRFFVASKLLVDRVDSESQLGRQVSSKKIELLRIAAEINAKTPDADIACSKDVWLKGLRDELTVGISRIQKATGFQIEPKSKVRSGSDVAAKASPKAMCNSKNIKSWLTYHLAQYDLANNNPAQGRGQAAEGVSYMGGDKFVGCDLALTLKPGVKNISAGKQRKEMPFVHVEIRSTKPNQPIVSFETRPEDLEFVIYKNLLESGIVDSVSSTPVRENSGSSPSQKSPGTR